MISLLILFILRSTISNTDQNNTSWPASSELCIIASNQYFLWIRSVQFLFVFICLLLMSKGPMLRIDTVSSIEYSIIKREHCIISIEQNSNRLSLVAWSEIKMISSAKLVYLKNAPNRVIKTNDWLLSQQGQRLLELSLPFISYSNLKFTIIVTDIELLKICIKVNKFIISHQFVSRHHLSLLPFFIRWLNYLQTHRRFFFLQIFSIDVKSIYLCGVIFHKKSFRCFGQIFFIVSDSGIQT